MALRELRVSNLAIIEEARLSFDDGFTVLTGETGSGKSMCVNALRAALGGRLEPETVRTGASAARVAAVFDNPSPRLRARRAELGIPDDDLITLSREVPASGRATCRDRWRARLAGRAPRARRPLRRHHRAGDEPSHAAPELAARSARRVRRPGVRRRASRHC